MTIKVIDYPTEFHLEDGVWFCQHLDTETDKEYPMYMLGDYEMVTRCSECKAFYDPYFNSFEV